MSVACHLGPRLTSPVLLVLAPCIWACFSSLPSIPVAGLVVPGFIACGLLGLVASGLCLVFGRFVDPTVESSGSRLCRFLSVPWPRFVSFLLIFLWQFGCVWPSGCCVLWPFGRVVHIGGRGLTLALPCRLPPLVQRLGQPRCDFCLGALCSLGSCQVSFGGGNAGISVSLHHDVGAVAYPLHGRCDCNSWFAWLWLGMVGFTVSTWEAMSLGFCWSLSGSGFAAGCVQAHCSHALTPQDCNSPRPPVPPTAIKASFFKVHLDKFGVYRMKEHNFLHQKLYLSCWCVTQ